MGLIRVVLAVVLATALLGASLPVAERVERDRNAVMATDELQELARAADRLAADNDPVASSARPAERIILVRPPTPTVTDGGRLVVDDDRLAWAPAAGDNHSVEAAAELRVPEPIALAEPTRLRLSLVRSGSATVVRIERARVQEGSRGQTARVRTPAVDGGRLPV